MEVWAISDDVFLVSSNSFISCIVTSNSLILSFCIWNSSNLRSCSDYSSFVLVFNKVCSSPTWAVLSNISVFSGLTSIVMWKDIWNQVICKVTQYDLPSCIDCSYFTTLSFFSNLLCNSSSCSFLLITIVWSDSISDVIR